MLWQVRIHIHMQDPINPALRQGISLMRNVMRSNALVFLAVACKQDPSFAGQISLGVDVTQVCGHGKQFIRVPAGNMK